MAEENPLQALEKAVDQYLEKHQINTTKQSIMQALDRYEKKHNDYISACVRIHRLTGFLKNKN